MPEIGETLREARMRRRIDMSEVEAATKIRAKYLRALESEEWQLLPGPTFVKTFLRTYADYLGLDSRLIVEEYKQRYERPAGMELTPLNLRRQARRRRLGPRLGPGVVVIVGVIALLGVLYALGRSGDEPSGDETPTNVSSPQPKTAAKTKKKKESSAKKKKKAAAPTVVRLRIVPTGSVYVCLEDARGRPVIDKATLSAGQATREFRSKRFRVTFGTAAARMRVSGKSYRVASSKDPVGYELRPGKRPRRLTSGLPTCS
jgi:cytoskeleton protein RodZ